jgi:DNA polymerase-3 subunit alpha
MQPEPERSGTSCPYSKRGKTLDEYLASLAREKLEERLIENAIPLEKQADYKSRLENEIEIIQKMGFSGYFLVVADFINYAKSSGIPVGPGRGSAAGSLVAYAARNHRNRPHPV